MVKSPNVCVNKKVTSAYLFASMIQETTKLEVAVIYSSLLRGSITSILNREVSTPRYIFEWNGTVGGTILNVMLITLENSVLILAGIRVSSYLKYHIESLSMKLNDPFGRLERRHQQGYESMRNTLRNNNINTKEAAMGVIKRSKTHAFKYIGIGSVILLPISLAIPKVAPVTLSLTLFLVVWIASSTINGHRYIHRYIKEELGK